MVKNFVDYIMTTYQFDLYTMIAVAFSTGIATASAVMLYVVRKTNKSCKTKQMKKKITQLESQIERLSVYSYAK